MDRNYERLQRCKPGDLFRMELAELQPQGEPRFQLRGDPLVHYFSEGELHWNERSHMNKTVRDLVVDPICLC